MSIIAILILELVIIIWWWWNYQKLQRREDIEEKERKVLGRQIIAWLLLFILIPIWLVSILVSGYDSIISIFGMNFAPPRLGLIASLPIVIFLGLSAIINKIYVLTGKSGGIYIIRGTLAIIFGIAIIAAFVGFFLVDAIL